jgi:RNA polymerase sigma factor (sigma-70 family)
VANSDLPEGVSQPVETMIDVQRVLDTVSESHRECLILKYVAGLTSAEIGELMELNSEAVDSLLQRARKAFATEWEVMHGEDHER